MSTADAPEAARAAQASHAARTRWVEREGNPVLVRSAHVVIERAGELPAALREQLHQATGEADGDE